MSKRKVSFGETEYFPRNTKRRNVPADAKKHSLDSDEEDDYDEAQDELDAEDIEGEEDGISRQVEGVRMTAFNMKEEMEEGHFDKEGHFIWNNEKDIRDNWLDNIDWHNVKNDPKTATADDGGLGADSDSDSNDGFDSTALYGKMLALMQPKESVNKAIRRLGGDLMKLSSVERLRRKKAGTLGSNEGVTHLTEFANTILTKTGNMNIYQETFEEITKRVERKNKAPSGEPALDMYAEDFGEKEKMDATTPSSGKLEDDDKPVELMWEFKWQQETDDVQGPFDTKQMIKWAGDGHFKSGVWVRKCGEQSNFYTSNRIDFELYE